MTLPPTRCSPVVQSGRRARASSGNLNVLRPQVPPTFQFRSLEPRTRNPEAVILTAQQDSVG